MFLKKNLLNFAICVSLCSSISVVKAQDLFSSPFNQEEQIGAKVEKNKQAEKYTGIVFDDKNPLGVSYIENQINSVKDLIEEKKYKQARTKLDSFVDWAYDATEFHTDLFKTLRKVDNSENQADIERNLAIRFAVLRDKTLFLDAKVLIAEGKKRKAVENLVEVVRSQPKTDLGFEAYNLLEEIGFTYRVKCPKLDGCIE